LIIEIPGMNIAELYQNSDLITRILLGLFFLSTLAQIGYYLFIYTAISIHKSGRISSRKHPVSVIICARNEADNLSRFLPVILDQDYPEFEVIVVNDASTDNTEMVLSEFAEKHENLRYTNIPVNEKFTHGKKLAVTLGIKAARHECLLFTDADCYPAGRDWIRLMAGRFTSEKSIVLGYGRYERRKGLLNRLIRYETLFTAIQYFSMAIRGKPYMGVGRNLAYKKELFFTNKGFASHYHIQSGDDDLFINEVADKNNTAVEFSKESHTISIPEKSFRDWIRQKKRHLKAGGRYSLKTKLRIAAELISRVLFYGTLVALCIISDWIWIALCVYGLIMLTKVIVIKLGMIRLDEKFLLLPSLILDPIMPFLLAGVRISGFFVSNNRKWK